MTKAELEQYRSIRAEIGEVQKRIQNGAATSDVELLTRLEEEERRMDEFIAGIPDSVTRRIFRYRYIDGFVKPSWKWIAFRMGMIGDGSTERKRVEKYLKEAD